MIKGAILAATIAITGGTAHGDEGEDWSDAASITELQVGALRVRLNDPIPVPSSIGHTCTQFSFTDSEGPCNFPINSIDWNNVQNQLISTDVGVGGNINTNRDLFGESFANAVNSFLNSHSEFTLNSPVYIDTITGQARAAFSRTEEFRCGVNTVTGNPEICYNYIFRNFDFQDDRLRATSINLGASSITNLAGPSFQIPISEFARHTSVAENQDRIEAQRIIVAANAEAIQGHEIRIVKNEEGISENASNITENSNNIVVNSRNIQNNSDNIMINRAAIIENSAGISALENSVAALGGRVVNLEGQTNQNRTGIAVAMAMSGGSPLQAGETFRLNANWGTWDGDNAFAVSGTYRASRRFTINAAAGSGSEGGQFGGRAGVSFGW